MIICKWQISQVILFVACSLACQNSFAMMGGTGVGNGGTVISLPDGSVVMSDPFVKPNDDPYQKFSNLNMTIQTELGLLDKLLVRYGAIADQSPIPDTSFPSGTPQTVIDAQSAAAILQEQYSRTGQSNFLMTLVASDQIQYHFVATLPDDCVQNEENIQLPANISGAITEMAGCTIAKETFIRQDLYAKMDNRNQTMLLLHERLHSLAATDHQNIINITTGAFLALDLYRQQSLVLKNKPNAQFSDFTPLTSDQVKTLQNMVTSIVGMNYLSSKDNYDEDGAHWSVEPNGGGIYFFNPDLQAGALVNDNASVSHQAFIGAGSILGKQGNAGDDAVMIHSACFTSACALGAGTSLIESTVSAFDENAQKFKVTLDPTAQMTGSEIIVNSPDSSAVVHLEASASISNSVIHGIQGLEAETASTLENSLLVFQSSDQSAARIDLGSGSDTNSVQALITTHGSPISGLFSVTIPAQEQLELKMSNPVQCDKGLTPTLSNDLSITALTSLSGLCAPVQPPRIIH
jgi:hypothetical protein